MARKYRYTYVWVNEHGQITRLVLNAVTCPECARAKCEHRHYSKRKGRL